MLIHDNIFDVDKDTLKKSVLFLIQSDLAGRQYVLTVNSDRLENAIDPEKVKSFKTAEFTKNSKFLRVSYQEQR